MLGDSRVDGQISLAEFSVRRQLSFFPPRVINFDPVWLGGSFLLRVDDIHKRHQLTRGFGILSMELDASVSNLITIHLEWA